ncbi:DNA topoisomerase 2 [Zea mays]|uniref:DNA topoisomerase 2 n=1 Tax=Zea mays TaxID=4577 RepID=A0A1D6HGY0_MAIZE|nr:DNA topoisomerase 2 [Zea mays]AQK73820.1 DNA topoisomerase 2 [Zea mays]AQK73828.1 DNA topoisomerase 2 [Zea mays]AQK73834.1 DNA topoisomerase 2 [Zea mays]AQK73837.1 DNA topoisomerase 2 [Zea mays]
MAAPLHSSSGHNAAAGGGAKTIEEMYQKKTQLEHILLRPDTYIGSVEKHTQALWIYEDGAMVNRSVTYVPGLYKIFDEILVNAADNKQRDPKMDALRVEIDVDSCCISVYNNGDGIPVEVHQEEGVYVPEMILGHLLTSSNYNDNEKKTTGGRNGYGAKLTNIFSTEFVIETADGRRQKKYKQVFYENMGKKSEPQITKCKQGENWTRVTFKPDLAKFNMTHLEDDVVALMRKRVVDMAGTLGKTVKVELDGQRVPIKSFCDYVDLYMKSANCDRPDNFKRIYEQVNDRWEVCVSQSEGQFQQVSFVNRIATIRGGSHVDYVTNQIANHVVAIVNKKNKNANMKLHNVKSHLWVFVNALIDNPAFDSQTKETLTTRQGSFGSKCELSSDFLKKVEKSGVIENVLSWADFKLSKELKKTDGSKKSRISGIPKLEDANEAGGKDSDKCTLILTEGDSAKALAMSGIAVVGRDYYGVFPLRGKLLNVREANHKQIMDNAEIQHIKQILGLQHGKQYESTKGLRYGHLMIMTDQDHDGSHIKGLLINFIHSFWPSLLKVPSFLVEFITPIIKATRGQTTKSFYTMPEYEEWRKNLGASASSWTIKYYKGLGTSTAKEGRKYFEDIIDHKKDFVWVDDQDGNHIELAFSKKRIADRKQWLTNFQPGTYIDQREKQVKYSDFINKELILFSMADLQRSIPSMVDGLKPGQRKILFCSFKRNFVKEAKVAQFSGYVSEHSAYHHGEQSLASTIIGMAQNFVGSNNINLMSPNGQFGTRAQGGKDAASPRYIFTKLSNITRSIFPKDDDILLNYLNEDGQSIEPTWYMPILPMVLVNGSEGIGTGWSTYIPNYNPRDIVANVRRLLNEESTVPMHPWYRGFKGSIEKTVNTKVAGSTYTVTGIIEVVDNTTLRITELPIRRWTQDYKDFLESLAPDPKNKDKVTFIEDVTSQGDNEDVYIQLKLSEANVNVAKEEGLVKKFKLTTTIGTTNMHLFDSDGKIRKYDTPEQILEEFFQLRLEFYCKRKEALLKNIKLDLKKLENKVRFIRCVVDNEIIVNNRKRADLFLELRHKNFDPFPKKKKKAEPTAVGAIEEEENEESPETAAGVDPSDYEYLLSMSIGTLTLEKIQELNAEKQKLVDDVVELMNTSPKSLWLKDLDAFEKELDVLDQMDLAEEVQREKRIKEGKKGGSKAAPKKQPKKAAPIKLESSTEDNAAEPVVAKRGAQQKKAPKKVRI